MNIYELQYQYLLTPVSVFVNSSISICDLQYLPLYAHSI